MMKRVIIAIVFLCLLFPCQARIIHVDVNTPNDNDGSDWSNAYSFLEDALAVARSTPDANEIWVAAGTYYPTYDYELGIGNRGKHFRMINNVTIYGGFAGTEDPNTFDLNDRDFVTNETIFSGDIGTPDDNADNCYHVFYHPSGTNLDSTAILNGLTITGGNANDPDGYHREGGGMYNDFSSPAMTSCTFSGNSADYWGGGVYNSYCSPRITDCTFNNNITITYGGGGMRNYTSHPILIDCRFTNNSSSNSDGGGMNNDHSHPKVINCIFKDNFADVNGGGMNNYFSNPTVINTIFSYNSADNDGGGMNNYTSNSTVTDTVFIRNHTDGSGGGMNNLNCSPAVINCIFSANSVKTNGGGMYNDNSSPTVNSCTFYRNNAIGISGFFGYGGGMTIFNNSDPVVVNCILWGNTALNDNEISTSSNSTPTITYSDIQGGFSGGINIIATDPLFIDTYGNDNISGTEDDNLRLSPDSPCIDTGDNSAVTEPNDLDGFNRIVDGDYDSTATVDMGAYEYQQFVYGDIVYVNQNATSGDNNGGSWEDAFLDLQDALFVAAGEPNQIWVAAGTYFPISDYGLGIGYHGKHFRMINGVAIYGGFVGNESNTFDLDDRDFETNETILSGDIGTPGDDSDNCYHVFYHPSSTGLDTTAVLDGFTITAGKADGPDDHDKGGGMYNDSGSPTVNNCIFTRNSVNAGGGGMHNYSGSSPTVTGCAFTGNSAGAGGGMLNRESSNSAVSNCIFIGNSVNTGGGGMFNGGDSSAAVTNCTFSGNSADRGGGIFNRDSSIATMSNCILWGNTASSGGNEFGLINVSTIDVDYCDVQGGQAGIYDDGLGNTINWDGGNIDDDPLFVDADGDDDTSGTEDDNLRLQVGSPCIDTGDNAAVSAGITTDLNGFDRFIDDICTTDTGSGTPPIVDMGAYEYLRSDINSDGTVGLEDFALLGSHWSDIGCGDCAGADLTCDGNVDISDMLELAGYWLAGSGS